MHIENKTVVFLCDVNNVLLMIASQFHKRKIKVRYIPDLRLNQHFRIWDAPIGSEYSIEAFTDFSAPENIDKSLIYTKSSEEVRRLLLSVVGKDSIVVGSDYAPAIFQYAGLKLDYFAVTGADVNHHTLITKFTKLADIKQAFFSKYKGKRLIHRVNESLNSVDLPTLQRRGIFNSNIVINSDHFNWTPLVVTKFSSVPYPLPGAVSEFGVSSDDERFVLKDTLKQIKENCDLLIVNVSKNDFWKGTHLFFQGFSHYRKLNRLNAKLLIFGRGNLGAIRRYAPEVDELIAQGSILILPPVSQRDVDGIIGMSDICFGGIWPESDNYESNPSFAYDWNTSLMQYAKMCKPIITYSPFKGKFSGFADIDVYPHESAKSAEEVCESIVKLEAPELRARYAIDMKKWIHEFTEISLDKWQEVLR
ncbi:hypothetical protein [Daejeonella lutea]|uniref:Uncharacterized protein n=1 Tax=Daejeonella lutea TaxID=572036 RepID=A0A1T5FC17_9SPHI|nr:hypothetical protein [Daejeonella lutea]SKB93725.1 hypothetical protein SAMN05661099_3585 [Daejeonella lutea]